MSGVLRRAGWVTGVGRVNLKLPSLVVGLAALLLFCVPATAAMGSQRARLTWDTDATDLDLHVWDASGNHAWFYAQDGIPDAELSTDIIYGYGPEQFEEFEYEEGRDLTFGVCYYGSNRDDDAVPETVATIELTDPDGTTRTLKRRLRAEHEAFYLGASPADGESYSPDDDWCSRDDDGNSGPYHPVGDDGGVGAPDDGGGSSGGTGGGPSFAGCDRTRRRLGVVELCADSVTGEGPEYRMSGNVRVNGGVSLGDGPIDLNTDAKSVTSSGPVAVSVLRGGDVVPVVAGPLRLDAKGTRDPISGRDRLATVTIDVPQIQGLRVAGLAAGIGGGGGPLALLLDDRDGGGVIGAARISLPFGGSPISAEAVALGVHAGSRAPVRVLGGTAKFGEVLLPGGWKFGGLELSYAEGNDTWTAKGGLQTPAFGLDVDGSLAGGRLNSLGIVVGREIPIGTSGFILTKLGGRVDGLATPPLKIAATASGKWGSVPKLNAGLVLLKDVTLTLDLSGRASLDGRVEFIRDGSPVSGTMRIAFAVHPFEAEGKLTAGARFGSVVDVETQAGIKMNTRHFTAAGSASGKLRGKRLGTGRGVVSDRGLGASGEICAVGGRFCATVAATMKWQDFPSIDWFGADINDVVTISRKRDKGDFSLIVKPGRPLLFVDASSGSGTGATDFTVRSPRGKTYSSTRERPDSSIAKDPATGLTTLTIFAPRPGRWRVRKSSSAPASFTTQTIRKLKPLKVTRIRPAGSKRKPLRRGAKKVKISWKSRLPAGTRVDVYAASTKGGLGVAVATGRKARGSVRVPTRALPARRNWIHLLVSRGGQPVDDVRAAKPVYVK